jgi:hypothetical protein
MVADNAGFDIVAIGEAMVEFNQQRPNAPEFIQGFGGDTSNAIIAAARQGARTAYITRLGADAFGDRLMALWAAENVGTGAVMRDPQAPTGVYFVTHGASGHTFSYLRAGSAASRMTPADLPAALIGSAKFLHVSGISQAISADACDTVFAAIALARAAGCKVAYDSNLRLKLRSRTATCSCRASKTPSSSPASPVATRSWTGASPPARRPSCSSSAVMVRCSAPSARERMCPGASSTRSTRPAPATASPARCSRASRRATRCWTR